jgi:hypothetical protein
VSVVANIARKVDRIEHLATGGEPTRDESAVDTAVDLLVYSLKYQTFLADLDVDVAAKLFGGDVPPPYSDGTAGFDALLERCDLLPLGRPDGASVETAATTVGDAFSAVEQRIAADDTALERQRCAADLASAAVVLTGALRRAQPLPYTQFLAVWGDPPDGTA